MKDIHSDESPTLGLSTVRAPSPRRINMSQVATTSAGDSKVVSTHVPFGRYEYKMAIVNRRVPEYLIRCGGKSILQI